jgi:hypothetical protein
VQWLAPAVLQWQCLTRLGLLQLGEAGDKSFVDIERFQSSNRMCSDRRVMGIHGRAPGTIAPEIQDGIVLQARSMDGMKTFEQFLVGFAQGIIKSVLGDPCSIAAHRRMYFHSKQRVRRRIDLERGIGMPARLRPWREIGKIPIVIVAASDDEVLRVLLRRMCIKNAIVREELLLLLSCQILIAEEYDTALIDEESKLIKLLLAELRQLGAFQLGPNALSEVHGGCNGEEIWFGWIGIECSVFWRTEFLVWGIRGCPIFYIRIEELRVFVSVDSRAMEPVMLTG